MSDTATNQDELRRRANAIRLRMRVSSVSRALVLPSVFAYGLFLMRPRVGHFIRYLAERRHFDPEFDALFLPSSNAACGASPTSVTTAAPRDVELTDREIRRKLMFARSDSSADSVTRETPEEYRRRLRSAAARPAMPALTKELEAITVCCDGQPPETADAPVVVMFSQSWFFSRGQVIHSRAGGSKEYHTFVGMLGSVWMQTS